VSEVEPGWPSTARDAAEWSRLDSALSLSVGFALLLVSVPDLGTQEALVEALRGWVGGEELRRISALDSGGPELAVGGGERPRLTVLTTVEASRQDQEALERCFVQLNGRRDTIVTALDGLLVVILRPDALRQLGDVAPDLYSVHASQFGFGRCRRERWPAPPWLLLPHEAVGVLGLDPSFGPVSREGMPELTVPLREPPDPLVGRELELELIEDLVLRGARRVRLTGAAGVGKTAVARAAVASMRERWDRVVWIDARVADDHYTVLHAVVAQLAEPGELPPLDEVDLVQRYRELTGRHAVLLVIDELRLDGLDEPSTGSLLIEIPAEPSSARLAEDVHLRPLTAEQTIALRRHLAPAGEADGESGVDDEELLAATSGLPALIRLVAHWPDLGARTRPLDDWVRLTRVAEPELETWYRWLHIAPCVPLDEAMICEREAARLQRLGFVTRSGDELLSELDVLRPTWNNHDEWQGLDDYYDFVKSSASEFARRTRLHLAPIYEYTCRQDVDETWMWPREAVIHASAAALPPPRRAEFYEAWAGDFDRQALVARLASFIPGARGAADRYLARHPEAEDGPLFVLLAELRPPTGNSTSARQALHRWEIAGGPAQLPPAIHAELRRVLGVTEVEPAPAWPEDPRARLVRTLSTLDGAGVLGPPDFLATLRDATRAWDGDSLPVRQLALSGLTWLHISEGELAEARATLSEAAATAKAWATPTALLRVRLLELELACEAGDLLAAAAMFDDLAERCEQLLGEIHEITLLVLARGVELSEGTANPVRARELAELCWRRSQYADRMNARAVASLVDYFEAHGFDSRAKALTADEPSSSPLKK
jgi:hypothetical protein